MNRLFFVLLFPFLLFASLLTSLSAQPIGTWQSFTSQSTVLEIQQEGNGRIWAQTAGGIFIAEDGEVSHLLTPIDGMYRINPVTMRFDHENELLWLGYSDGTFESFDYETGNFRDYTDITRATRYSPRGINQFVMLGNVLLIATDFGLVLFDPVSEATIDTYSNLGTFTSGTRVNSVVSDGLRIYAATSDGVAVSAESGDLVVPDNWTSYGAQDGFESGVSKIVMYDGAAHALMDKTLLRFDGSQWQEVTYFQDMEMAGLRVSQNGEYLIAWNDEEVRLWHDTDGMTNVQPDQGIPINTAYFDHLLNQVLIGSTNLGIKVNDFLAGGTVHQYLPSGPYMNNFSDVNVRDGVLISGSTEEYDRRGLGTAQSGYYIYRDNQWENYNNATNQVLSDHNYRSVFLSAQTSSHFFFGSWGHGIAQHDIETDEIKVWNNSNSDLVGLSHNPAYVVIRGLTSDRHDNVWAVSYLNTDTPLFRLEPDAEDWQPFPRLQGLLTNDFYIDATVDSHDQLWITMENNLGQGRGLVVKRIEGDEVGDGVIINDQSGSGNLPHPKVNAVVQDRRGEIWIGTQRGLARIAFPQRVIDGGPSDRQASLLINADETADSPYLLRTTNVTSIAVNSANQKWIGTDGEGVWLVEEDGGRHRAVKNFTTENSPLISNTVNSIAYDDVTGQVFFATELGLISYTDVVRGSEAAMDELFIYPNPFSYNREDNERVVIDRLSSETTIRILTVDGRLVRRLDTRGGRVEWDVRDFKGDRVATGVYIVVSVDEQNDQRGVGKLVVIR